MGPEHVENPERLRAVQQAMEETASLFTLDERIPLANDEQILRVHDPHYLASLRHHFAEVRRQVESGSESYISLGPDLILGPRSEHAILRAAGASVKAVDDVASGTAVRSFVACRPPGHHAEKEGGMGFCFLNNIMVAAAHALATTGLKKVAILDFDVHHGNGTQKSCWDQKNLFFASTHQASLYPPNSGTVSETGKFGNIVNVPLQPGADGLQFRDAISKILLRMKDFAPELILLSAGFDAHQMDPLGGLRLETEDYEWATDQVVGLAREQCGGKLVSFLEGGYDVIALHLCVRAHLNALFRT